VGPACVVAVFQFRRRCVAWQKDVCRRRHSWAVLSTIDSASHSNNDWTRDSASSQSGNSAYKSANSYHYRPTVRPDCFLLSNISEP